MRVSKHHYALELAERGSTVYFIEPPDLENKDVSITPSGEHAGLFIVKYKPVYRGKRFLPSFMFRILVHRQVDILIKAIGKKPDVLWCFDPYRFMNLKWFKAPVSIFFAADLFPHEHLPEEVSTADFSLGVSDSIVQSMKPTGKPVYFINHGLSRHFTETARKRMNETGSNPQPKNKITVGYVGNLLMEAPDRKVMQQVISGNPDAQFIFWGQYEKKGNFVGFSSPEVTAFIEFLQAAPNVTLRGAVHPSVLNSEIEQADMFWICWQINTRKLWDGSNSHKILEYLSTGNPVVSHYMSTYHDSKLVDILRSKENDGYAALFSAVKDRVKNGEPVELKQERIRFAIANSYNAHITAVESLIQQHAS